MTAELRTCGACKGAGVHVTPARVCHHGYGCADGTWHSYVENGRCFLCRGRGMIPEYRQTCLACRGAKQLPAPDGVEILRRLVVVRGGKQQLRKSPPPVQERDTVVGARAYFVWRMARFHGGVDVSMPVSAEMGSHGDPWQKELDGLAGYVARHLLGTDLAAARRWGSALGLIDERAVDLLAVARGDVLPSTAYSGGEAVREGEA